MSPTTKPTIHSFTIFFSGSDVLDDEQFDALYEAGCDDALFGVRDGAQYGAFDREAGSFSEALASAIADLTSAVPGLQVVRIEPDELLTMAALAPDGPLHRIARAPDPWAWPDWSYAGPDGHVDSGARRRLSEKPYSERR